MLLSHPLTGHRFDIKGMAVPLQAESLVHFRVTARRLALPDTSLDLAWVDDRIDVIGPMRTARLTRYPIGTHVVLLSVNPVIASAWLGMSLHHLTDRVIDLRDVNSPLAGQLADQSSQGSVRGLVKPGRARNAAPLTRAEISAAHLERGASVASVAQLVNLGQRQFTRQFHWTTGLHPKPYQRIVRLRNAITVAKRGATLAEAAAATGFTDQSHFNREIKALTGGTPRLILPNVGNVQDIDIPLG